MHWLWAVGSLFLDLFVFDISTRQWTNLTDVANGTLPSRRYAHGFCAVNDQLYVHGGQNNKGE